MVAMMRGCIGRRLLAKSQEEDTFITKRLVSDLDGADSDNDVVAQALDDIRNQSLHVEQALAEHNKRRVGRLDYGINGVDSLKTFGAGDKR